MKIGKKVLVVAASLGPVSRGTEGRVLGRNSAGYIVRFRRNVIVDRVTRAQIMRSSKVRKAAFCSSVRAVESLSV